MPIPIYRDEWHLPGQQALVETFENEFLLDGPYHRWDYAGIIDGTSTDAAVTDNTSFLRKGMLMSLDRSTNKWKPWSPVSRNSLTAIYYNQSVDGILGHSLDLSSGSNDRNGPILRIGRVRADRLITAGISALGLDGNAYRYLVGRQLAPTIQLDNPDYVLSNSMAYINDLDADPLMDLTKYPNGTHFICDGNAFTFTLPAPLPGWEMSFTSMGDGDIVFTSAGASQFYGHNVIGNTLTVTDEGATFTLLGVTLSGTIGSPTNVWALINSTPATATDSAADITIV